MATKKKETAEAVTARATAHLDRLEEAKGKRLVVDLDAPAREALEALLTAGHGSTQREVVCQALVSMAKRKKVA